MVFLVWGVLAPLLVMVLFSCVSYSLTAGDYWDFYEKYITRFTYLEPYSIENTTIYGESSSGYTFVVRSSFYHAYDAANISYYYLSPGGVLFKADDLPVVTFRFRFLKEYYQSGTYPSVPIPILALSHYHESNEILLLYAQVKPGQTTDDEDQIEFYWWRIYFDPSTMTTKMDKLNITDGSFTYIFLKGRTVFSTDIQISIIPAIYLEKVNDTSSNTTYYNALFGYYTMVNVLSQNVSSGFAVAWKTLRFYPQNITSFQKWLDRFNSWFVWLGTGYFIRTDILRVKVAIPCDYLTNGDYVEIKYSNIGVFDARIDKLRYYYDLVSGLLPEYEKLHREQIDLANQQVYGFDVSKLTPILMYMVTTIIPGAVLRKRSYLFPAVIIAIVLDGVLFYILYNDLGFLVFSGILALFAYRTGDHYWRL